jgi:hypothetical protein
MLLPQVSRQPTAAASSLKAANSEAAIPASVVRQKSNATPDPGRAIGVKKSATMRLSGRITTEWPPTAGLRFRPEIGIGRS